MQDRQGADTCVCLCAERGRGCAALRATVGAWQSQVCVLVTCVTQRCSLSVVFPSLAHAVHSLTPHPHLFPPYSHSLSSHHPLPPTYSPLLSHSFSLPLSLLLQLSLSHSGLYGPRCAAGGVRHRQDHRRGLLAGQKQLVKVLVSVECFSFAGAGGRECHNSVCLFAGGLGDHVFAGWSRLRSNCCRLLRTLVLCAPRPHVLIPVSRTDANSLQTALPGSAQPYPAPHCETNCVFQGRGRLHPHGTYPWQRQRLWRDHRPCAGCGAPQACQGRERSC